MNENKQGVGIKKSGDFSQDLNKVTSDDATAAPESAKARNDAPQSVLNSISEAAVQEDTEKIQEKKFSLPKISVNSFYNKKHLKRKIKLAIGLYCIVVFGVLLYGVYRVWDENTTLNDQWEQREVQYVKALTGVNLSEYNKNSQAINAGLQTELDPVLPMFMVERIASDTNVLITNPGYTINSSAIATDSGIELSFQITGTRDQIVAFLKEAESVKPIMYVTAFDTTVADANRYNAQIAVEFLHTTYVDEKEDEVHEKFLSNTEVNYPISGIAAVIAQLSELQAIVMEKVGTFELGKQNLFAS